VHIRIVHATPGMKSKLCYALLTFALGLGVPGISQAYGPIGHQIVGAIADRKLAGTAAGEKISALLDGMTLERVSVIADEIKGWDKRGADDPNIFHYSAHPRIDKELVAFWNANKPTKDRNSPMPSHHWFHYTDVSIIHGKKYSQVTAGRSRWDIVQMIPYCVEVLRGERPENNERKITKTIAVILLAHYVGDIHQPLHVGAQFFNAEGQPVDPDKDKNALEDQGGNTIFFYLSDAATGTPASHGRKFHVFWDLDTVDALLPALPLDMPKEERREKTNAAKRELSTQMAQGEPKNWRLPANVSLKNYAEVWADEILPLAREAHDRLEITNVKPFQEGEEIVARGHAREKRMPDGVSYRDWSVKIVREHLHKAGWRLADLLEQSVR
jgi:hypothetical protein